MAIPTMETFAAGQRWRADDVNSQVRDAVTFAFTAKSCRATSAAATSISDSTWTSLTFNNESFDTDGWHSTSTNTDRITPNLPGIYRVEVNAGFAANPTGMRGLRILKNGSTDISDVQRSASPAGTASLMYVATTINMNGSTDYLTAQVWQSSTAPLALTTSASSTTFIVTWIGA